MEGLRERHVKQAKITHFNTANGTDPAIEDCSSHAGKAKKTFGRTPDGTGEQETFLGEKR